VAFGVRSNDPDQARIGERHGSHYSVDEDSAFMSGDRPLVPVAAAELDRLFGTLKVEFVRLSECIVGKGYRLELGGVGEPGLHYNISGTGRMIVGSRESIPLAPHTLVILPAKTLFRIEVPSPNDQRGTWRTVDGRSQVFAQGALRRYVATDAEPELVLICGYFHASYGASTDLFATLKAPIVEQFEEGDQVDESLRTALMELVAQEVGFGAMSAALLKQVIVALLRRSLRSMDLWVKRFSLLSDPQIARAFADMVAHPGARHSLRSLARTAFLSRSAFVARFSRVVGRSPMMILRDLRMRQAADQLRATTMTVDEIAHHAGYASRSSFVRAFRKALGDDPTSYRSRAHAPCE
jgi:AraC family transcriptional regulator, activator of mtrCDE